MIPVQLQMFQACVKGPGAGTSRNEKHRLPLVAFSNSAWVTLAASWSFRAPDDMSLELAPFIDYGYGVNHHGAPEDVDSDTLAAARPGRDLLG